MFKDPLKRHSRYMTFEICAKVSKVCKKVKEILLLSKVNNNFIAFYATVTILKSFSDLKNNR